MAPGTFFLQTILVDSCESKQKQETKTQNLNKYVLINILNGHVTKRKMRKKLKL